MKRSLRTLAWFAAALSAAILQPAITSASAAEAETVKNVIAQQLPNVPGGKTLTHHHAGSALVAPDDATLTAPGGK